MSRALFGLTLVVAAFAQATVLPAWWPLDVRPNVVLILVLLWGSFHGVGEGVLWAAFAGAWLDVLALDPIGTNGLALLPVVLLAAIANQRWFRSRIVLPFVLTLVAALVQPMMLMLLGGLSNRGVIPPTAVFQLIVPQALLCAIFVPPLYALASWFDTSFAEG